MCFALAFYHQVSAWLRKSVRAQAVHSYSSGLSWHIWDAMHLPPPIVQRFVEPVLAYGFGRVIAKTDSALAFWFRASAALLFVKGQLQWWSARSRLLNTIDSHLESAQLQGTVSERLGSRHSSAEVPPVVESPHAAAGVRSVAGKHFEGLDPVLKKLFSGNQEEQAKSCNDPTTPVAGASPEEPMVESPS